MTETQSAMKFFWEITSHGYAHLRVRRNRPKEKFFTGYNRLILNHLDYNLKGKTVIDYGCGGGFLGALLFNKYKIKKYIGIDIAERSLKYCERRLYRHNGGLELYFPPKDLKEIGADIIFSFAMLQHIPTEETMEEILDNMNTSGVEYICLHYRHGGLTIFRNEYLKEPNRRNVGACCVTNNKYLKPRLSNYRIINTTEVFPGGHAQGVIYKRKMSNKRSNPPPPKVIKKPPPPPRRKVTEGKRPPPMK